MAVVPRVRLFDTAGTEQPLPEYLLADASFILDEKGGCDTFSLALHLEYEDAQLSDWMDSEPGCGWRVELEMEYGGTVYPVYAGWVDRAEPAITEEGPVLQLQGAGAMARCDELLLNGVYVRAGGADVSEAMAWVAAHALRGSDRLDAAALGGEFITDLPEVGYDVERADFADSTARAALDHLAELCEGLVVWGWDRVGGTNRLYLRAKPTTADIEEDHRVEVGREVLELTQPRDLADVKNGLVLRGGSPKAPNLAYNGSFEVPTLPGETASSNLLQNPGAEEGGAQDDIHFWTRSAGSPLRRPTARDLGEYADSGNWFFELDDVGDTITQTVDLGGAVAAGTPFLLQFRYACELPIGTGAITVRLEALDSGGSALYDLVATETVAVTARAYQEWRRVVTATGSSTAKLRLTFACTDGGNDTMIDSVVLARNDLTGQDGWRIYYAPTVSPTLSTDWSCMESPHHGNYAVRVMVGGLGANQYVVFAPSDDRWSSGRQVTSYELSFWLRTPVGSALDFYPRLMWLDYKGRHYFHPAGPHQTLDLTAVQTTAVDGEWHRYSATITTAVDVAGQIRPEILLMSNGQYDIDELMLREANLSSDTTYVEADQLEWRFRADNEVEAALQLTGLSAEAAASISTYGLREEVVDAPEITDLTRAKQFAVGWLNQHAVLEQQGTLTLEPFDGPPLTYCSADGTLPAVGYLSIAGLSQTLTQYPSRITYRIGASGQVRCELDLIRRRLDPALLLMGTRQRASRGGRARRGGNIIQVPGAGTSAPLPVKRLYGPDEASPYTAEWGTARTDTSVTLTLYGTDEATATEPVGPVQVVRGQVVLIEGVDYTISGSTLTFESGSAPIDYGDGTETVELTYTPSE